MILGGQAVFHGDLFSTRPLIIDMFRNDCNYDESP